MNKDEYVERVEQMAKYLPDEGVIIDFGCGSSVLKKFLNKNQLYIGVDKEKRDGVFQCDLNKDLGKLELVFGAACFCSGILEYLDDVEGFLQFLSTLAPTLILSYACVEEHFYLNERKRVGWLNNFNRAKIRELVNKASFMVFKEEFCEKEKQWVFVCKRVSKEDK